MCRDFLLEPPCLFCMCYSLDIREGVDGCYGTNNGFEERL